VVKFGRRETQRAVNQKLAKRRAHQILTTNHFGDSHGRIVYDHG